MSAQSPSKLRTHAVMHTYPFSVAPPLPHLAHTVQFDSVSLNYMWAVIACWEDLTLGKVNRAWQAVRQACKGMEFPSLRDDAGIIPIREQNTSNSSYIWPKDCSVKMGCIEINSLSDKPHSGEMDLDLHEGKNVFQWMWYAGNERQAENTVYLPVSWEHNQHYTPQSLRTVSPASSIHLYQQKAQMNDTDCSLEYSFSFKQALHVPGCGVLCWLQTAQASFSVISTWAFRNVRPSILWPLNLPWRVTWTAVVFKRPLVND